MKETLTLQRLEEFTVVTFTIAHQRSKDIERLAGIVGENHLENLLVGIFHHLLAGNIAVSRSCAGEEQTHVVINLGGGAYGRARVLVGSLLFYADDGRKTCNLVNVRSFHAAEEVACIGRERLDVASLSFGKDSVEGE